MAVLVVREIDGCDLAIELKKAIEGIASTVTIHNWREVGSEDLCRQHPVNVFILTPLLCKEIQESDADKVRTLLSNGHTLLMYHCEPVEEESCRTFLADCHSDSSSVFHYNGSCLEEWFMAEAKIKILLAKTTQTKLRQANKFILRPETITNGQDELLIILLQDDEKGVQLDIAVDEEIKLSSQKLRASVWSCSTRALEPGTHTLKVSRGGSVLGSATFSITSPYDDFRSGLGRAVRADPRQLLSHLLNIDVTDVDSELDDVLREPGGNAFIRLVEGLLLTGETDTADASFPTIQHLCARYDWSMSAEWVSKHCPGHPDAMSRLDSKGRTPLDVAREAGANDVIHVFETIQQKTPEDDDDEVFKILYSPAKSSVHGKPRDSGNFSNGSVKQRRDSVPTPSDHISARTRSLDCVGSVEYRHNVPRLPSDGEVKRTSFIAADKLASTRKRESFPFRRQHHYEEIRDREMVQFRVRKDDPYSEPWDQDSLPAGPLPTATHKRTSTIQHSRSDGQLPRHSRQRTVLHASDPSGTCTYVTIQKGDKKANSTFL